MKMSRFIEAQIMGVLRQANAGLLLRQALAQPEPDQPSASLK